MKTKITKKTDFPDFEHVYELKILKIKLEQKELELTHQRYLIQELNFQLNKYLIK